MDKSRYITRKYVMSGMDIAAVILSNLSILYGVSSCLELTEGICLHTRILSLANL